MTTVEKRILETARYIIRRELRHHRQQAALDGANMATTEDTQMMQLVSRERLALLRRTMQEAIASKDKENQPVYQIIGECLLRGWTDRENAGKIWKEVAARVKDPPKPAALAAMKVRLLNALRERLPPKSML